MRKIPKLRAIIQTDWMIALLILGAFLLTHGYIYGWDDQAYEIPLLKGLIDPELYAGDYFVETLKTNFTSYLYLILSKIITVDQIPPVFFVLYLVSRYFLFFWFFKIWRHISRSRLSALACTLTTIVVWQNEEFLYRSFSHQELALSVVFAGIYLFYKERFIPAALIFGFAANIHALYSLYPTFFLLLYLTWQIRRHGFKTLAGSACAYLLAALPFLWWVFKRVLIPGTVRLIPSTEWIPLYRLACPLNFVFLSTPMSDLFQNWPATLQAFGRFLPHLAFFVVNFIHNPVFRRDKKVITVSAGSLLLVLICFFFTYVYPYRIVLDLNLIWSTQYLQFFLGGYTALLVLKKAQEEKAWLVFLGALAFSLMSFGQWVLPFAGGLMALIFLIPAACRQKNRWLKWFYCVLIALGIVLCLKGGMFIVQQLLNPARMFQKLGIVLACLAVLLAVVLMKERKGPKNVRLRQAFVLIPILIMFVSFVQYHWYHIKAVRENVGFWGLQNGWEDMQRYVRAHTPKSSSLMIPNDMEMGGFRILSERKVLVCYRDCGVVGFDYSAGEEWYRRISDMWDFKVMLDPNPKLEQAMIRAIDKYRVNYIVFMRYYAPPGDLPGLKKLYENDHFSLFQVIANPVDNTINN